MNHQSIYSIECSHPTKGSRTYSIQASSRAEAKNKATSHFRHEFRLLPAEHVNSKILDIKEQQSAPPSSPKVPTPSIEQLLMLGATYGMVRQNHVRENQEEINRMIDFLRNMPAEATIRFKLVNDQIARAMIVTEVERCIAENIFSCSAVSGQNILSDLKDIAVQIGKTGAIMVKMASDFQASTHFESFLLEVTEIEVLVEQQKTP